MGLNIKKWFSNDDNEVFENEGITNQYYNLKASELDDGSSKMVLLEPRAYSEAQQIADELKNRNTVVVNLKRVTGDQAKRIIDFLSGTIYAIGGKIQKVGGSIFLCTPNNVAVQGEITGESTGKGIHDNDDLNIEW